MKKLIIALAVFALVSLSACKGTCPKFHLSIKQVVQLF